jgi:hypothetical protein
MLIQATEIKYILRNVKGYARLECIKNEEGGDNFLRNKKMEISVHIAVRISGNKNSSLYARN